MGFTRHATDLFISERIGQLTKCGATDVARKFPGSNSWTSTFGLCVIFQNRPPEQNREFALQFVRRVEAAFGEYSRAVENLEDLVCGGPGRWSPYFRSLYHFEAAISQLYLAYDGARKKLDKVYFLTSDGSDLSRLNEIYNASKHYVATSEQTLWISDDGICATKDKGKVRETVSISFLGLEELLCSYGRLTNEILGQDSNHN